MNSSVKVPYLYLTTDPAIIEKLKQQDGTMFSRSVLEGVEFLIGPEVTDKLISFELNFNYEGQKYGLATLDFLDIDGDLETKFIQKSANLVFSNYYSKIKQNPSIGSSYEEYSNILNSNKTPKFFLGFGISENLADWSGPYICSILRTDMNLESGGLKRISVQFQLADNSLELKTHDPDIHKGYVSDIVARNMPNINVVAAGGIEMPVLEFLAANPTDVLTSAMADYLQVVSDTKNIITILPDLSFTKDLTVNKQQSQDAAQVNSFENRFFFWTIGKVPASDKAFNSFTKYDTAPGRLALKLNPNQYRDLVYFPTIRKFYKKFGADVIILPKEMETVQRGINDIRSVQGPTRVVKSTNWVQSTPSIDADTAYFEDQSYISNLAKSRVLIQFSISSEESKEETGQENNPKPDFYIPIKKLQEGFNNFKLSDTFVAYNTNFTLHYESNPNVIKSWMDLGLIENNSNRTTDCVIVMTSDQVRNHWIYGHGTPLNVDIQQRDECPIKQSIADLLNTKSYRESLGKICKYYMKGSSLGELDSVKSENQLITNVFNLKEFGNIETPMTIFTCNTTNPNVISFNLATYPAYVGLFNYGINTLNEQLATDAFTSMGPIDRKTLVAETINNFDKDLKPIEKELVHYFFEDEIFKGFAADVMKRREGPVEITNPRLNNLPTLQQRSRVSQYGGPRSGFDSKIGSNTESFKVYEKVDKVFKKLSKDDEFFDKTEVENSKKLLEAVFQDLAKNESLEGIDSKLKELVETVTPDRLAAFLTKIFVINQQAKSPKIFNYTRDPFYLQKQIYDYMSNSYLELNLKTLPFFHLDGSHFGKYCTFLHHELLALPLKHNPDRNWSFLTGLYIIHGFRHVISNNECFTEVALKRAPMSIEEASESKAETKPEIEQEQTETKTPTAPQTTPTTPPASSVTVVKGKEYEVVTEVSFDINNPKIPTQVKNRYLRAEQEFSEIEDEYLNAETKEERLSLKLQRNTAYKNLSYARREVLKYTEPSVQAGINNSANSVRRSE